MTEQDPIQVKLADGSLFTCSCDAKEFRVTTEDAPDVHMFCRCGQVYVTADLPPLWEG